MQHSNKKGNCISFKYVYQNKIKKKEKYLNWMYTLNGFYLNKIDKQTKIECDLLGIQYNIAQSVYNTRYT